MNKPAARADLKANSHRFTPQSHLSLDPVPLEPYGSADFFERERAQIYGRAWLMIGRVEDLPEPGSFFRRDIDLMHASVVVTRTKSGAIKAFHNMCSHRGTQLVQQAAGRASRFVCPYHNWTYGNEGQLIGIPDEASFFGVDKKNCGLTPVAIDTWDGFLFVNLQPEPEVSLAEFLGPLAEHMIDVPYKFADNCFVVEAEINANWKVVSDAFLESYHIPAIHPETIGATFSSRDNPFAHLLDAKLLGPHAAVSMYGNPSFELEEKHKIDRIAQKLEGAGSVISASKTDSVADFLAHPAVNPTKSPAWSMDAIYIFPHTHIDMGPGGFWVHQFWPLAVDKTRHIVRFFMAKPTTVRERLQQELYVVRVMEVIAEDVSNTERTQRGIASGAKRFMQLQDNEIAIRHSVNNVLRWVAADTVREALSS